MSTVLAMLVGALGGLVFSVLLFGLGGVFSEMLQDEGTAIFLFGVAGVIVGLVAGIVVLRMSFVFPAVSVDEDYKMAMSWRSTIMPTVSSSPCPMALFQPPQDMALRAS